MDGFESGVCRDSAEVSKAFSGCRAEGRGRGSLTAQVRGRPEECGGAVLGNVRDLGVF